MMDGVTTKKRRSKLTSCVRLGHGRARRVPVHGCIPVHGMGATGAGERESEADVSGGARGDVRGQVATEETTAGRKLVAIVL